jgi:hypothetical protein
MARVFTDEELRVAGLRSVDALAEALESNDREAALGFARRLRREALSMLANYDGWEATLRSEIVRLGGEAEEAEAMAAAPHPAVASEPDAQTRWREMATRIAEHIEAGEGEAALALARALHDEALARHDRGMSRVTALLSWVGRRHGTDDLEAALTKAMASDLLGDASYRERALALMHFTRVHLQPFRLEEDDEKLTFLCAVCPSGGRLLREGHYDPPRSNLVVEGPRPFTYGRSELPVYCCHEPVMEKASIEATGEPLFIVEPSERLGEEPCRTYLYKDPARIPERFYTRLGLEKPKSSR